MTAPDPAAGHLHPCGCVAPSVNTLTLSNYQRGYDAGRADERRRIREGSVAVTLDNYLVTGTEPPAAYHVPARLLLLEGDDGD